MKARAPWRVTGAVTASALALLLAVEGLAAQAGDLDPVPVDLNPLLTDPPSELRLVTRRYVLDRRLLHGNYAGANRTDNGLVVMDVPPTDLAPLSRARLSRLKRFDRS